jgi:hypothetical protein
MGSASSNRLLLIAAALCLPLFFPDVSSAQTPPPEPVPQTAAPQTPAASQAPRLRVFLECSECDSDYLRDEIQWVDFVRQPQDADVHLLSSSTGTGGGGREIVLRFVGRGRFQGADHELRVLSVTGDATETIRRRVLRTVTVGLLQYLAREGQAGDLTLTVRAPAAGGDRQAGPVHDPWRAWVFSIRGSGSIQAEETNRESEWSSSLSADRVTERWKISFGANTDTSWEEFDLDEDEPLSVTRREHGVDGFVARSLGPHWSLGLDGGAESSTFGNVTFSGRLAPAIEYSVFPYAEYATRQLRFQYSFGVRRAKYREITLFDKLEETLGQHEIEAVFEQEQPWGSVEIGADYSQYLHDLGKYRLEVDGELSLRVTRGLSLNVEGSASRIRDQISLPRRGATQEEVLLRLRELQSGYEVQFSLGITYSFGSIFNNIVNPRFGR